MMWLALVVAFLALFASAWAVLFALAAIKATKDLEGAVAACMVRAAAAEQAKTDAIEQVTAEIRTERNRMEALRHKYETTLKLYQDSIAIDGPMGSKRVQ